MNEELKKLMTMLEEIKAAQEAGKADTQAHKDEVAALETRIKELEAAMKKRSIGVSLPDVDKEVEQFSFLQAAKGILHNEWGNGFEKRVFEETRKKAMEAGTDTSGGYIVPSEYVAQMIELLRANTVLDKVGATVMNDLKGSPVELPKQESGATAYWVGENQAFTESALGFGMLELVPKQVGALCKLSNRLLRLSNPAVEGIIRSDMARVLGLAVDLAGLRGTGGKQPVGIANTPSIGTHAIGTNGGDFTFSEASKMEGVLDDANALNGNLAYVMHSKVKRVMKMERIAQYSAQTNGAYVILPMSDKNMEEALGYGVKTTTQLPVNLTKGSSTDCSEVYFLNWKELIMAYWGGMELLASNVAGDSTGGAMTSNQTWLRAIIEVDIALRHPASACLCSDARVNNA